jgi:hypothetical protein
MMMTRRKTKMRTLQMTKKNQGAPPRPGMKTMMINSQMEKVALQT